MAVVHFSIMFIVPETTKEYLLYIQFWLIIIDVSHQGRLSFVYTWIQLLFHYWQLFLRYKTSSETHSNHIAIACSILRIQDLIEDSLIAT